MPAASTLVFMCARAVAWAAASAALAGRWDMARTLRSAPSVTRKPVPLSPGPAKKLRNASPRLPGTRPNIFFCALAMPSSASAIFSSWTACSSSKNFGETETSKCRGRPGTDRATQSSPSRSRRVPKWTSVWKRVRCRRAASDRRSAAVFSSPIQPSIRYRESP